MGHDHLATAAEAMRRRVEREIESALFGGSTSNAWAGQKPLTIDALGQLMKELPPRETWISSGLFALDGATVVKADGENITYAHPNFWMRVDRELRKSLQPAPESLQAICRPTPMEIDPHKSDSDETAAWRAKERKRVLDILSATISATAQLSEVTRAWWRRP